MCVAINVMLNDQTNLSRVDRDRGHYLGAPETSHGEYWLGLSTEMLLCVSNWR